MIRDKLEKIKLKKNDLKNVDLKRRKPNLTQK
jgi:hypothetical protein